MALKIAHANAQSRIKGMLEAHFQSFNPKQETVWGPGAGGMISPKGSVSKGVAGDIEAHITHRYQVAGDPKHVEQPSSFYVDYSTPGYKMKEGAVRPVSIPFVIGRYVRNTIKNGLKTMRVGETPRQTGQINIGGSPYR